MDRIESTIVVNASPMVCYDKWHHFEQFPHFMENVEAVEKIGNRVWHWEVRGPLGQRTEWDAILDRDEPGQLIAWHSLSGSSFSLSGMVTFQALPAEQDVERTAITCELETSPQSGWIGDILTHLLLNPEQLLIQNLEHFKALVEGTNVPAARVHVGHTLEPDPFVVPPQSANPLIYRKTDADMQSENRRTPNTGNPLMPEPVEESELMTESWQVSQSQGTGSARTFKDSAFSGSAAAVDEDEYELIYGMEDDLPAPTEAVRLRPEDALELQMIQDEEVPYLGAAGALSNEDWIEIRDEELGVPSRMDVFTDSMDVSDEDLDSFREELDTEMDTGSLPEWQSLRGETSVRIEHVEDEADVGGRSSRADAGLGPREVAKPAEGSTSSPASIPPASEG